jgi:hypothetical protein
MQILAQRVSLRRIWRLGGSGRGGEPDSSRTRSSLGATLLWGGRFALL